MKKLDYDRRPEAWEHYRKFYDDNHILKKLFNLNIIDSEGKATAQKTEIYKEWDELLNKNKLLGELLNEDKKVLIAIQTSGDTDFNFYTGIGRKKEKFFDKEDRLKYDYLKKWCKENKLVEIESLLKEHLEKVHKEDNLSLMLTTGYNGALQFIKEKSYKTIRDQSNNIELRLNDNICVYIKKLNDEFFEKNNSIESELFKNVKATYRIGEKKIVDNKNKEATNMAKECMALYLNFFKDIYDYCEKIYGIDEKLVKDMIGYAEYSYSDNQEDIIMYLSLIDEFWKQKKKRINTIVS